MRAAFFVYEYSAIEIESRRKITVRNQVIREKRNQLWYRIKQTQLNTITETDIFNKIHTNTQ